MFNGLHQNNDEEKSLEFTDGGMCEGFVFKASTGDYEGEEYWLRIIELTEKNKDKIISLISKKNNLISDIQSRIFILASYLLVANENVIITMIDLDYGPDGEMVYYPEYNADIGFPLSNYKKENNIYLRKYNKGLVLTNPSETETYSYSLDKTYKKVIPSGGGSIKQDGTHGGSLSYQEVSNEIELKPMSGVILLN